MFLWVLVGIAACTHPPADRAGKNHETSDTGKPPAPFAIQGTLLGYEAPTDPFLLGVLAGSAFAPPIGISVFYALADSPEELDDAPVNGGSIIPSFGTSEYVLQEYASGWYGLQAQHEYLPEYVVGEIVPFLVNRITEPNGLARVTLPAGAKVAVPETLPLGEALAVDFSNQGYTSAFAVVLGSDGAITWSNEPVTILEMYAANTAGPLTMLTIPAVAFPTEGTYALGLGALTHTWDPDLDVMEATTSAIAAGRVRFFTITVAP